MSQDAARPADQLVRLVAILELEARMCSEYAASVNGRPASTGATFTPASASRFAAQPPEAPEPTTRASKA